MLTTSNFGGILAKEHVCVVEKTLGYTVDSILLVSALDCFAAWSIFALRDFDGLPAFMSEYLETCWVSALTMMYATSFEASVMVVCGFVQNIESLGNALLTIWPVAPFHGL